MPWGNPVWSRIHQEVTASCEFLIGGTIYGHLPSGKNNYRMDGQMLFKHKKVGQYENDFAKQIGSLKRGFPTVMSERNGKKECLILMIKVFFRDYRRDVDTILFCDLLQKSGIIENDRCIRVKIIDGIEIDPKDPRVEFRLYRINETNIF